MMTTNANLLPGEMPKGGSPEVFPNNWRRMQGVRASACMEAVRALPSVPNDSIYD